MPADKILFFQDYRDEPMFGIGGTVASDYVAWLKEMYQIWMGESPPDIPESRTATVTARINAGRWLWECPACRAGVPVELNQPSICPECGTQGWVDVVLPANREDIEAELLKQPGHRTRAPIRHWLPHWSMETIQERTRIASEKVGNGEFPQSLSIGMPRDWAVNELLTAGNKNTYERDILKDLIGDRGIIELRHDSDPLSPTFNQGGLRIPWLTTAQRTAQTTTNGTEVYDTDLNLFYRYENGTWVAFTNLAGLTIAGAAHGDVLYLNASGNIVRLAAGTVNDFLQTKGAGADPVWALGTTVPTFTRFTANGTWTKPTGIIGVLVQVIGGGGGGIRTGATNSGGEGGEIVWGSYLASALGATVAVTVGDVGGGGVVWSTANPTRTGNLSAFGALNARGGRNGQTGATLGLSIPPGTGGGPTFTSGTPGHGLTTWTAAETNGANSTDGTGSGGGGSTGQGQAGNGGTPGGGGGSSNTSNLGGPGSGARGEVRVWTW